LKFLFLVPLAVANLPALEIFDARDNQLSGPLPKFNSEKLKVLALENNHLSQTIPDSFGEGHLDMIDFNVVNNDLIGTLPNSLCLMTNLIWLQLSENHFYGSIPPGIGNMRNLKYLYLNGNNFVGDIPRELTPTTSLLTEVWFQNNLLSGTVPAAFAEIPSLKNLYVDGEFRTMYKMLL
jgi:Leucine-rich repeat (LRR) protein